LSVAEAVADRKTGRSADGTLANRRVNEANVTQSPESVPQDPVVVAEGLDDLPEGSTPAVSEVGDYERLKAPWVGATAGETDTVPRHAASPRSGRWCRG